MVWLRNWLGFGVMLACCTVWGTGVVNAQATASVPELVEQALRAEGPESDAAILELRKKGPEAVNYLCTTLALQQSPRWPEVLDQVARQKDAMFSGLFWHTDLDEALQAARQQHKPVLSLRLLGKLSDELSCANSRFFRTTLYPQKIVRDLLADRFVLHWQSVRDVPIITIDLGNGRQIRRTITGNSLHLVLDEQGRPVDVLPGLYAAGPFVRELEQSGPFAVQMGQLSEMEYVAQVGAWHQQRLNELNAQWQTDCQRAQITPSGDGLALGVDHDAEVWAKIAQLYAAEAQPQGSAAAAVATKFPAEMAMRLTLTKSATEAPLMRQMRNLTKLISEDSVRNEYCFHATIHQWLAGPLPLKSREVLVKRVYAQVFMSPVDDPWYGLSWPDAFSAIANDGRIHAVTQNTGD